METSKPLLDSQGVLPLYSLEKLIEWKLKGIIQGNAKVYVPSTR